MTGGDMISLERISVIYRGRWPRRGEPVTALSEVSLRVSRGAIVGLVGESGSGKSTLGRVILRLQRPDTGSVRVNGVDPFALRGAGLLAYRRRVQAVFQDSEASLNPRRRIAATVGEGLDIHQIGNRSERRARVEALLDSVGLDRDFAERFPHALSGGQRQRVNIARSLALDPDVLVADEPVSALDVAIQSQILDLLLDLHARLGLTIVFISHDLSVVRALCDTVAVMHGGRIVEVGPTDRVLSQPSAAHTRELLAAAPSLRRAQRNLEAGQ